MLYPRLLTAPKPKAGDSSRHVFEVAYYATPEVAAAGKNDWLVVEWHECDYLRATKMLPVMGVDAQGNPVKIGEAPGDGKPEEDIKGIIDRWLAVPANLLLRGDLRTEAGGGFAPPPRAAVDPHGVEGHPKVVAMRGKPVPKPERKP